MVKWELKGCSEISNFLRTEPTVEGVKFSGKVSSAAVHASFHLSRPRKLTRAHASASRCGASKEPIPAP